MKHFKYITIALIINLILLNTTNTTSLAEAKLLDVKLNAKNQRQIYKLCDNNNISFALVIAVIEKESKYKADAVGDNGNSIGLMQIQPKWHKDRMKKLGVADLLNPTQNAKVGVDFLKELFEKYGDVHQVLMCYNMGEPSAKKLWNKGIYTTEYSRDVVNRSIKIEEELKWKD